jgi:hypothetical protein
VIVMSGLTANGDVALACTSGISAAFSRGDLPRAFFDARRPSDTPHW